MPVRTSFKGFVQSRIILTITKMDKPKESERGKEIRLARAKLIKKHLKYLDKNPEKMAEEAYFKKHGKRMPIAEHRLPEEKEIIVPKATKRCDECNI